MNVTELRIQICKGKNYFIFKTAIIHCFCKDLEQWHFDYLCIVAKNISHNEIQ